MLGKLLNTMLGQRTVVHQADLYRNLIRHEAKIGGSVFGPVPKGHRREFFCLDERTWVWHEEWKDAKGQRHVRTTRYDLRPDGILKTQNGNYQRVQTREARRLFQAVDLYIERVNREIYNGLIATS